MSQPPTAVGEDHLHLLTRSTLNDYLSFMSSYPIDGATRDRKRVTEVWLAAQRRMVELREREADWADLGVSRPIDAALFPLVERVVADPVFSQAYANVAYEIATVDLARLVVSQKLVSLPHVRTLQEQLGSTPSAAEVFRFCLPYDRIAPSHRASWIGDEQFAFTSASNDLRFLDAVLLRPDQIVGYQPTGPIAGVVALVVGFGANYLHALSMNGRLILNNGNHRACALYDLGIREAPCVVQTIVHPDEIEVHAPRTVRRNLDFYVTDPRPPVLKDYFDTVLTQTIRMGLNSKQVRVSYSVEEKDVP